MTRAQKLMAAGSLIAVYFLALTWRGLGAWFTGDDLTNIQFLHGFGQRPFAMLLVHCAVVITPEYRPLGGAVYRILYALFGLEPLPFRLFCYALLLLNLFLAGLFVFVLTGSRINALLAALIFAVHTSMGGLYFNTGTLYDILCFTFGVASLILYVHVRLNGAVLAGRRFILFLILYGLALDSKEMAIAWPALLISYELVFHRAAESRRGRFLPIATISVVAALYGLVKTQVPNQMSMTPAYVPHLSLPYMAEQLNHYYWLLLWNRPVQTIPLLVSLAALLALAIALRSRAMVFGLLFANLALLPLAVIPGRSGFALYIPYLGWALYAGTFLSLLISRLPARRDFAAAACFILLLGGLYIGQRNAAAHMGDDLIAQEKILRSIYDGVTAAKPDLAPGSRILIADDPFGPVNWTSLFLIRLAWHDATLWVDRPSQLNAAFDPADLSIYSAVVHAATSPVRVSPGVPLIREPETVVRVVPASVSRGGAVSVEAVGFPGCSLDVEYRMPDDELARSGLWKNWCTLDALGKCRASVDRDAERGIVQIRRIRPCGNTWHRANASFEILP